LADIGTLKPDAAEAAGPTCLPAREQLGGIVDQEVVDRAGRLRNPLRHAFFDRK
jgi:hypothetical protein